MALKFSEGTRQGLSLTMAIISVFLVVGGVGVIPVSLYVKESAAKYRHFITSKDNNTLHNMLLATGILLTAIGGIGGKLFLTCRKVNSRRKVTFPLFILGCVGGSIKTVACVV